jgi:hypothetical protein
MSLRFSDFVIFNSRIKTNRARTPRSPSPTSFRLQNCVPTGPFPKLAQSPVKHFRIVPIKEPVVTTKTGPFRPHAGKDFVVIRSLPGRLDGRISWRSGGGRPHKRQKRRRRGVLRRLMRRRRGDFGRRRSAVPAFPAAAAVGFLCWDRFGDYNGREIQPQNRSAVLQSPAFAAHANPSRPFAVSRNDRLQRQLHRWFCRCL